MSTLTQQAQQAKNPKVKAKRGTFEDAWREARRDGAGCWWLSAFCLAIVRPLVGRPFHPANLLAVPRAYAVKRVEDYHFAKLEYTQESAQGYNGSSRGHGWSTWAIVAVDEESWRMALQIEHFRVWSEWTRSADRPALRPMFGKAHGKNAGKWSPYVESCSSLGVVAPPEATFPQLMEASIAATVELQRHYRQQTAEYLAFLKKHPVDLTLPKGFPTVAELLGKAKEPAHA